MQELVLNWYALLGAGYGAVAEPLSSAARQVDIPLLSALLLGILGATSPCQFTTGVSALAFIAGGPPGTAAMARSAAAYVAGKALVYTVVGLAVILAGQALAQAMVPVVQVARQALGPLMILLALHLFGLVPLRWSLGSGWMRRSTDGASAGGRGAFLLGVAFGFAFCPTLFLLFFGLTIPLALGVAEGPLLPPAFALGTTLPLLALVAVLAARRRSALSYVGRVRRLDRWLRPVAGLVLLATGLNDTLVYWFL